MRQHRGQTEVGDATREVGHRRRDAGDLADDDDSRPAALPEDGALLAVGGEGGAFEVVEVVVFGHAARHYRARDGTDRGTSPRFGRANRGRLPDGKVSQRDY